MQTGEVGIEITPVIASSSLESRFAAQLDALLRRACQIARAMTGAEQAALKLWVGEDSSQARKYFSLSESYAAFRDFRVDPKGIGPHHPPMRGWLATSVYGDDGRLYGLLQLSDKSGGREFDVSDETNIEELMALIGEMLDALRLAAQLVGVVGTRAAHGVACTPGPSS